MENKNKKSNASHVELAITFGDIAIAVASTVIYCTSSGGITALYELNPPSILVWVNLLRVLVIYSYFARKLLRPESLFKVFVASNLVYIPAIGILTSSPAYEYYPLYLLLIMVSVYRWEYKQALVITALSSVGYIVLSLASPAFSLRAFIILFAFLWVFFIFVKVIIDTLKISRGKLMEAMDNLNQRTWELEIAQSENEIIYNTVANLAGTINVTEIASKILGISTRLLESGFCRVYRISTDRTFMHLIGSASGDDVQILEKPERETFQKCIAPLQQEKDDYRSIRDMAIKSGVLTNKKQTIMFVPLVARGELSGCIITEGKKNTRFSEKDRYRYSTLGSAASMALDNALLVQKTKELAIIDELTGMYNFRYFKDKLHTEIQRAIRYKQHLSMLMIDIDHFKNVNDQYGHQAGNMLLQQLSGLLGRCIRKIDIPARYGGEEFAIILPETSSVEALTVAERIRSEVENSVFECGAEAPEVKITVSIGIGQFSDEFAKNQDLFIGHADKNLYLAKKCGRNRIIHDGNAGHNSEKEYSPIGDGPDNNTP
jgi:diguanylate cyclase (GGDEF)-like protein